MKRMRDSFKANCTLASLAAMLMGLTSLALARECEIGEIKLRSQSEVDRFEEIVGGGGPCRVLTGELIIEQQPGAPEDFADPIVSLDALADLVEVHGILGVVGNPKLERLDGLSALERVEGRLFVSHNRALVSLDGLRNLREVDTLELRYNGSLRQLSGLQTLETADSLRIWSNPSLVGVGGLDRLASVDHLFIRDNPALLALDGLGALETFRSIGIEDNPSLRHLDGLAGLRLDSGSESVTVRHNDSLRSIQGLNGLRGAMSSVSISNNPQLTSLAGLEGLTRTGLALADNAPSLGLEALGGWTGGLSLELTGFAELENLDALASLERIEGLLLLVDNERLADIDRLSVIEPGLLDSVFIRGNGRLPNLDVLRGKMAATSNGITLERNAALAQIEGLLGVSDVFGNVVVRDNPALENLDGLNALEWVGRCRFGACFEGNVLITGNPSLEDCSALGDVLGHPVVPHDPDRDRVALDVVIDASNGAGAQSPEACLLDYAEQLPDIRVAAHGSWYDPRTDGEGFMLFTAPNQRMSIYFYGYDDAGQADWLLAFADGPFAWNAPIPFTAFDASGGTFDDFDPLAVEVSRWGSMSLTLDDCDSGRLDVVGPPGAKTLEFTRLVPTAGSPCSALEALATEPEDVDSLTGAWFDPDTNGQGFTVHRISAQRGLVYFFGFRDDGSDLWLVGVWNEPVVFGQSFTVDLLSFAGGAYQGFLPEDVRSRPWGVLTLRFDDCRGGTATLRGADGFQSLDLQLLAGAFGLPCGDTAE